MAAMSRRRARCDDLRRDHHGRQRRAGRPSSGLPVLEGHRQGARTLKQTRQGRRRARHRGADRLRVLDRELVASRGRGRRPDGDVRRADRLRDPGARRGGRADAVRRPPRPASPTDLLEQMDWAESETAGNDAHDPVRRLQLRRPRRDPRRGRALRRGRGGGVRAACSTRRRCAIPSSSSGPAASSGSRTSCSGRAPTRSSSSATALARLRPRRAGGRAAGVRVPAPPLRRPRVGSDRWTFHPARLSGPAAGDLGRDARPQARARRQRRPRRADLRREAEDDGDLGGEVGRGRRRPARAAAVPTGARRRPPPAAASGGSAGDAPAAALGRALDRLRDRRHRGRRPAVRGRDDRRSPGPRMVEFFRMTQRARPFQLVAFAAVAGMILAAHFGDSFHIVLAGVAFFPVMLGFALARPSLTNVTWAMAVTVFGDRLDRPAVRARGAAPRPAAARRRPARRRARRHLLRRHLRLRRRPDVRAAPAGADGLAEQDDRGPRDRGRRRRARLLARRPLPGLAVGSGGAALRPASSLCWHRWATCSSR